MPLTLGQEFSGYVAQLNDAITNIETTMPGMFQLAIGGTAVGTGLNAPEGFGQRCSDQIADVHGPSVHIGAATNSRPWRPTMRSS